MTCFKASIHDEFNDLFFRQVGPGCDLPATGRVTSQEGCLACLLSIHRTCDQSGMPGLPAIQSPDALPVWGARPASQIYDGHGTRQAAWGLPCGTSLPVSMALFYLR